MNRTIREAAQVLGVRERALRDHLRTTKALNKDGTVAAKHYGAGNLMQDTRSRINPATGQRAYYGVVLVTEAGIGWLAQQLGVTITTPSKDAAA